MHENKQQAERCLLIGVDSGEFDSDNSISELTGLAESAGAEVVATVVQKREAPDKSTCIGSGKLVEIAEFCTANQIDLLIFDLELSATQIRNIEDATGTRTIDRTTLILDIFARRAQTRDGKLQVELAQLRYKLPRLTGMGVALSRLGGGIGTRGPGETKLESDRRHIRRRIESLEDELRSLEKRRKNLRTARKKSEIKTVAIVGYTNVGKSTLLNALTGSEVLSENMLFATLDPTARSLVLPNGQTVLLVDTVGFVSRLPHHLVEAFKSTLEEAVFADLILNVCDISSPYAEEQLSVSNKLLEQLGCDMEKIITVYNQCDKLEGRLAVPAASKCVTISAVTGYGFNTLISIITEALSETVLMRLCIPFDKLNLLAPLRDAGKFLSEKYTEKGVEIEGYISKRQLYMVEAYVD